MTPFYFGTSQRRLFGIFEPARMGGAGTRAAVLCYPWGAEYLYAHRAMRQLAINLSAAGFHTLRFDYFGTGDSAGEATDGDLQGWQDDIASSMQEIREMTGATRTTLVGMRLGATLAAVVAASRSNEVDALVLWDPVVSGQEYLKSLRLSGASKTRRPMASAPSELGGGYEIQGFPLTDNMVPEFQALDLLALVPALPSRTLIVVSEPLPSHDVLRLELQERSTDPIAVEPIASLLPWIEDPADSGALPVDIIKRIAQWVK
jgi:pimeloyl-ACP methyl ester carboxylesterase